MINVKCVNIISCLCVSFLSSSVMAAENVNMKPITINIANDHQASVSLSSYGINRLFVLKDKVLSVNSANNRLIAHNDQSGSVFMSVSSKKPFVAFVSTLKGRHFSLLVTPQDIPGATVKIIPKTPASGKSIALSPKAKQFESSSPYEKTLVKVIKTVMKGRTPPGYTNLPSFDFGEMAVAKIRRHPGGIKSLSAHLERVFLGGDLAVRVIKVTNVSKKNLSFLAGEFYHPGVRAISVKDQELSPKQSTYFYEVMSNV